MSINRNLLKKFLTTTSVLAVIAGGIEMAEAAAAREVQGNATFSTGNKLNGGTPFVTGSTLKYTGAFTTQVNVNAVNISGIDVNGFNPTLTTTAGATTVNLGSVVDITGGGNLLGVTIAKAKALVLTGTAVQNLSNGGIGFFADTGAGGQPEANVNDYTALGNITFAGVGSTLTVTAGGPITLDGTFINPGKGVLNVNSALTLTDVTGATINAINVGAGQSLTFDVGNNSLAPLGAGTAFADADSTIAFKVDANGGKNVTFAAAFDPVTVANDDFGKVIFENTAAAGGGHLLTVDIGGANLGNANDHRLRQISTAGTGEIKFQNGNIFAKLISIGGTGDTEFAAFDSGDNSTFKFTAVNDGIKFGGNTTVGTVDFNGQAGVITVADGVTLTTILTDATAGGAGKVYFTNADGTLAGTNVAVAKGIAMLKAGDNAKTVNISGKHKIAEVQGLHAAGTIAFANNAELDGAINSTGGAATILEFKGSGVVTGTVGANAAVGNINLTTAVGIVDFQSAVKAAKIDFQSAGMTAKLGNNLTGDVDFTTAGTLTVYGASTIDGAFLTPANGTLNVNHDLLALHDSVAAVNAINIANGHTLTMTKGADLTILNGKTIAFGGQNSILKLQNIANGGLSTVTMKGPLAHANDDTGTIVLHAIAGAGGALTLRNGIALNPVNSLGTDDTHRLHELRITGDDAVTVNVDTYAKNININSTGNVVFSGVIDAGIVDSEMKFGAASNVTFNKNTTTKTIDFNNNASTITVAVGRTLTAILADSTGNSVGTVEFAGNGNLTGTNDAVADGIAKIKAGANLATVTITGKYNVVEIEGANAGGKIEFANGFDLTGSINSTSGAATKLKFLGNAAISGVTGRLGNAVGDIELAAASTISFGDSVHMGTMTADDATVKIENDLTIVGAINGNNTTIDVGPNALTYQGAAALTGNVVFKTEYKQVGNTIGSITVDGGGNTLNLAGAAGVTVNLESDSVLHTVENQNYVIAKTNAGGAIAGFAGNHVVNIVERNALVKWEFDKNTFTFTARDNVVAALLPAIVPGGGVPNAFQQVALDAIADPNATGDAAQFQEDLGRMTLAQQQEAIEDALTNTTTNEVTTNELQNVVAGVIQEMVSSAVAQNMTTITNRLNSFTPTISPGFNSMPNSLPASGSSPSVPGVIQQQSGDILGVSAGDVDTTKFGFWGSPFYSKAIQKSRDKTAGYRAAAYGGIIGFDTMPNDDMILGIAGAYIDTNVKHRNEKTGDRTKAATHLLSIYGMQQLPKNWFAQAIVSFSHSDIRNMERRLINVNNVYDTALGKYSSASVGGEILLGYSHYIPDYSMAITPMGGFRYAKFNDAGYKETGSRRNLVVAKKSTDKLEAVLGIRAVKMIEVNGVNLMPELHGSISQDLTGKAPKIDARVSGMNRALPTRAKKPPRTFYNVGTGISAKYHMMEYSLGYDLNLAKKYTGHQGTVKIRVNF